jgi:hypothetical protein
MSAIPLHLQRRFEQRRASRFTLPVAPGSSYCSYRRSRGFRSGYRAHRKASIERGPVFVEATRTAQAAPRHAGAAMQPGS